MSVSYTDWCRIPRLDYRYDPVQGLGSAEVV